MRSQAIALCLAALVSSTEAKATLINEGEYTLDTNTNLEWLSPALTDGLSYNSVQGGAGGWTMSGWQFATADQFISLAETYVGPQVEGTNGFGPSYYSTALSVVTTLGPNASFNYPSTDDMAGDPGEVGVFVQGFVVDGSGVDWTLIIADVGQQPQPFGQWDVNPAPIVGGTPVDGAMDSFASFLVRPAVPETSTCIMMLLGFAGLGFAGYRGATAGDAISA
jgi:hypothetical protein